MPATPGLSDVHQGSAYLVTAPEPCPICAVAMLGSRTNASHQEFDRFEGFNGGLVMDYSKMS
jgi:tRNA(Arg) A34 adenosine deaminase TadA